MGGKSKGSKKASAAANEQAAIEAFNNMKGSHDAAIQDGKKGSGRRAMTLQRPGEELPSEKDDGIP